MLDINFIRQNSKKVKKGLAKKHAKVDIDKVLYLDMQTRKILSNIEGLRAKQNKISKAGKPSQIEIQKLKTLKSEIKKLEKEFNAIKKEYTDLMYKIPNLPLDEVPEGKDEKDNIVIKEKGKRTSQRPDYLEIATKLDLIDIKRAAKVSGSRFGYIKNKAVLLEFAMVNFAFDTLIKEGFTPVIPPVLISKKAMRAMGYWDHDKDEIYYFKKDDLCLVGTSEQSIGPMHMNETLTNLPKRYVAFSNCFRREAGSYGKDTRGLFRVHQFDKIEMFSFCHPDKSIQEHEFILEIEEKLMQALEIPYRVVQICAGDLGNSAANKYDIEAWFPAQQRYRETHSCSNCTDFQARRLNIKYGKGTGKYVHTLNGTVFSQRPLLAILENFQRKDGTIQIPKVLQKYTGFKKIG